jgi:hypothetical protein
MWKMMKGMVIQDLTELTEMLKKCKCDAFRCFKYENYGCATKFIQRNSEKGLNFSPGIGFSTIMLWLTRCSVK